MFPYRSSQPDSIHQHLLLLPRKERLKDWGKDKTGDGWLVQEVDLRGLTVGVAW
jgi:hypothetical protein